jgi:hypothetical protein
MKVRPTRGMDPFTGAPLTGAPVGRSMTVTATTAPRAADAGRP